MKEQPAWSWEACRAQQSPSLKKGSVWVITALNEIRVNEMPVIYPISQSLEAQVQEMNSSRNPQGPSGSRVPFPVGWLPSVCRPLLHPSRGKSPRG